MMLTIGGMGGYNLISKSCFQGQSVGPDSKNCSFNNILLHLIKTRSENAAIQQGEDESISYFQARFLRLADLQVLQLVLQLNKLTNSNGP